MAPNKLKTLYGVGVMNYGEYDSLTHPKAYSLWAGMLERCYSSKSHEKHPTYKECTVCTTWHNFQNFVPWFEANYVEGYHLDKDLIISGNKVYSASTCVFVPRWLNNVLLDSKGKRGPFPMGVSYKSGKYQARFSCHGKSVYLGVFTTVALAKAAYQKAKGAYLIAAASAKDAPAVIKGNLILLGQQLIRSASCQ